MGAPRIVSTRPCTTSSWDRTWSACDYATYFQSRAWAQVFCDYRGGRSKLAPMEVVFADGRTAVLPLTRTRRFKGLVAAFEMSPAMTFGGWISTEPLGREHATLLVAFLRSHAASLTWRINPYDPSMADVVPPEATADDTHVVELIGGFKAVTKAWTKGHLSAAKKARREGVKIEVASSLDDWREYFDVYRDSIRRWGDSATMVYDWRLFARLAAEPSSHCRLWTARYEGTLIAGAVCLYAKTHVAYWHGAALQAHFKLRPVHYLLYEAMADAEGRGFRWFDFNPSGGLDGVRAFKRGFGASARACPVVMTESPTHYCLKRAAQAVTTVAARFGGELSGRK